MYIPDEKRYENMKYNRCGESGLKLPEISLGLWQNFGCDADYDEIRDIILTAFDNGITHFDLANNYGPQPGDAERNFGRILKEELMPHRDELIISTKAGYEMWQGPYGRGGSRKYLMSSLDQSLQRMGLDYVDIFYHHCFDEETPYEETALCMGDIARQGKALYIGISNYDGRQMHRINHFFADYNAPYIVNQNRYSILDRTIENNGLKEQSARKERGIVAFSPLAQGRLSNKFAAGIPKDSRLYGREEYCKSIGLTQDQIYQIKGLCHIAEDRGETLSQMAINWLLTKGVTSVLIGVRTKAQLLENLGALAHPKLSDEEMEKIDNIVLFE